MSSSIPINVDEVEEDGSVSKISDTESRISHLEMHFSRFTSSFNSAITDLKCQSKLYEENQSKQDKTLSTILELLQNQHLQSELSVTQKDPQETIMDSNPTGLLTVPSDRAISPNQLSKSGGSPGAAGAGS